MTVIEFALSAWLTYQNVCWVLRAYVRHIYVRYRPSKARLHLKKKQTSLLTERNTFLRSIILRDYFLGGTYFCGSSASCKISYYAVSATPIHAPGGYSGIIFTGGVKAFFGFEICNLGIFLRLEIW